MQPCNRIYYSTVHWSLNMFRAAYRSSSGALTVFVRFDYGRSPHVYVNQRLQIQLELLIMSGVPLGTCWAYNETWNNKFYYKVVSCWLFLLSVHAMCVLIFSAVLFWNISNCMKYSAWYYHKCTWIFIYGTRNYCQILMNIDFSSTDFQKFLTYKISWECV
jgi:hypothetical protein